MIGLDDLRNSLMSYGNTLMANKIRKSMGINVIKETPVILFAGSPETGKTSIASIVAGGYNY